MQQLRFLFELTSKIVIGRENNQNNYSFFAVRGNQSIGLQHESVYWFLDDWNLGCYQVK